MKNVKPAEQCYVKSHENVKHKTSHPPLKIPPHRFLFAVAVATAASGHCADLQDTEPKNAPIKNDRSFTNCVKQRMYRVTCTGHINCSEQDEERVIRFREVNLPTQDRVQLPADGD